MAITRWDPFGEMLKMQRDMDRIFSRMGTAEGRPGDRDHGVDAAHQREAVGRRPGGPRRARGHQARGRRHRGHRRRAHRSAASARPRRARGRGLAVRESSFGSFERSIVLPEGVDPASIRADFHDGMLEVHVPKALELARPKTTRIAIGGTEVSAGQQAFERAADRAAHRACHRPAGGTGAPLACGEGMRSRARQRGPVPDRVPGLLRHWSPSPCPRVQSV